MSIKDARRRTTPIKSTLLRLEEVSLLRSNAGRGSFGFLLEPGRSHARRAITRPPAGPLNTHGIIFPLVSAGHIART